jgi:hypothetical protein
VQKFEPIKPWNLQKLFPKTTMSKPIVKNFTLQDDDEKIWNNVLDNFEDGAHEGQSSSVDDDSEN